ncbi:hypothetical protein [Microaceticoccus formicicus]|uniref:hypothetical protein n=1 Tax=Microaceticoccus formicicus TaxID=3118105 RepID=UPI003CD02939|nr:hypothetical protein VZL98_03595 [Peptoniphilaceae bacterium AMB_02]
MICKSCSNEINNVKYCPHCGAQNINFISNEDSLLNRPSFNRDEQEYNENLLNNDYEDRIKEETASDRFGEDLNSEPRREVFDEASDKEYHFNEYDGREKLHPEEDFENKTDREDHYSQGSSDKNYSNDSFNYNNDETIDKLWAFLGKVNKSAAPIASKIYDMGLISLIVLVLAISILNSVSVRFNQPVFTSRMFFNSLLTSIIGVVITFFFLRFVFNYVAKQHNVYVKKDELNVCLLLSMLLSSFIRMAFGNSILIAILNSFVSTLLLLALIIRRLNINNYKSIGIKYVVFNIVFMIIFYVVLLGLLFAIFALAS